MSSVIGGVPRDGGALIGRTAELAQLCALQMGARLLTLQGPCGVGKTRLGLRLAARVRGGYPDGVWFIDLSSVADDAVLEHAVARVLDVRPDPGRSVVDAVVSHLRDRQALLILDACEAVLDACGALARTLWDNCPQLHLLVISRAPLNTSGDTIWRTPPLSVPSAAAAPSEVALAGSVRLLVSRARQRGARFSVTRANSAQIRELCRCLGGLPLALEIVAAQMSATSTPRLMTQLRAADAQSILRTTLDWAQTQLSRSQQVLLRRASVFAGPWTVTDAQAVCADKRLPARLIEADLNHLVRAALVHRESIAGQPVYRLLDTIRAFATDALIAAGEDGMLKRSFLNHVLTLAERTSPEALSAEHAALLEREVDNIRAAMTLAISSEDAEQALRLATAACSLWYFRGNYAEGCVWLERALQLTAPVSSGVRARASAWLGQLLQFRGEYGDAERWLTQAAQLFQSSADALGYAVTNGMLGQLLLMRGELARAVVLCGEAAERLSDLGQTSSVARHLEIASRLQLAIVAIELGDLGQGRTVIAQCKAQGAASHPALAAWLNVLEGRLAAASHKLALAQRRLTQALELSRATHEQAAVVVALVELGNVLLERHSMTRARVALVEAVDLARHSGERIQLARALESLAAVRAKVDPAEAVRLTSAAARLRTAMGAKSWPSDRRRTEAWLPAARLSLEPGKYRKAWKHGQATGIAQVVALARSLAAVEDAPGMRRRRLFTMREQQIINLVARALTNEQIAAQLHIRPATARTHVEHLMRKLQIHRRAELVLWASQQTSASVMGQQA